MKIFYITIIASMMVSCQNTVNDTGSVDTIAQESKDTGVQKSIHYDSLNWAASFLELRKAIIMRDRRTVKKFFDFPIMSEGNEIWYVSDSRLVTKIEDKPVKPFTEANFDIYFNSIFPKDFRSGLEQLKPDRLFRTGKSSSMEVNIVKGGKVWLEAAYDSTASRLALRFFTTVRGQYEFATIYEFQYRPDRGLRFLRVYVRDNSSPGSPKAG